MYFTRQLWLKAPSHSPGHTRAPRKMWLEPDLSIRLQSLRPAAADITWSHSNLRSWICILNCYRYQAPRFRLRHRDLRRLQDLHQHQLVQRLRHPGLHRHQPVQLLLHPGRLRHRFRRQDLPVPQFHRHLQYLNLHRYRHPGLFRHPDRHRSRRAPR